jgi:peroxiredoxin (alkyl hydroperoxide reductase subunit C)
MSRIANIGEKFPQFSLTACVSTEYGKEFGQISSDDLRGQWAVVFFWPYFVRVPD